MGKGFYKILTYGCQMNVHESEKLAGILTARGFSPTENNEEADVIVFNTCCIRESAESRVMGHIGALKRLAHNKPNLIIAVCGCMSQQSGMEQTLYKKFPFISIVLGTHNIDDFGEFLDEYQQNLKYMGRVLNAEDGIREGTPIARAPDTNAWINITYGCNNFCTYCIVPYVRGRERSREACDILAEARELIATKKYKTLTLLGQNVNSFGKDLPKPITFARLLEQVAALDRKVIIQFMTSHPKDFSDELIELIAKTPNISRSIHLPVQAGSSKTLKAMNRGYTREHYVALVERVRNGIPDADITTDIIVGFPGETDDDYQETEDLVKQIEFNSAFIFMYSKRKGTPAATMDGQVPIDIKRQRIHRLQAVQKEITRKKKRG